MIDHGQVVARGHIDALRRASQRRADPAAARGRAARVALVERRGGKLRLRARRDVDRERVLAAAERAAQAVEFSDLVGGHAERALSCRTPFYFTS